MDPPNVAATQRGFEPQNPYSGVRHAVAKLRAIPLSPQSAWHRRCRFRHWN